MTVRPSAKRPRRTRTWRRVRVRVRVRDAALLVVLRSELDLRPGVAVPPAVAPEAKGL